MENKRSVNSLNSNKLLLFKVIGILLPVLLLILLEILLRLFGYGSNPDLFVEYAGNKDYLTLNPEASKKFFANQRNATTGNAELFRKIKDVNTLRIFVLGESTTIGYPYFHNGSFHRWLQYRLMHSFPERNFEIINLSLTAVNSYTVLSFAKDLVDYQPDAVFIYTGHNEYYGALGVGSTENFGNNPAAVNLVVKIRRFRIVQLATNVYQHIAGIFGNKNSLSGETRMKLMVKDQQIPYQSKAYRRGVEQFRSNMDQTLAVLSKHHIPVFISNLVSNEKDLRPFVSFPPDSLQFPAFSKNYRLGLDAGTTAEAYRYFRAANEAYQEHASCNYYLGEMEYALQDFGNAKKHFTRARDRDGLRFRAPEDLNRLVAALCSKYPGVHLVDTKALFEAHAGNHVIGSDLILEHVHPNLLGYALLSEAFYNSIKKEKLIPEPGAREMSLEELLRDMPVLKTDSLSGAYKIARLKQSWPFNEALKADPVQVNSEEEKLASDLAIGKTDWVKTTDALYNFYISNHELKKARRVMENLVLEYPTEEQFYEKTAMLCGELKEFDLALFYFRKTFALSPSFEKARFLFVINLQLDRPDDALPFLDYAISDNSTGLNLLPIKAYATEVIRLKARYAKDSTDIALLNQIGSLYLKMDNREGALKYFNRVLEKNPGNKDALSMLSRLKITR